MKKNEEVETKQNQPDIAKFLLKDTDSLRNEIKFTKLPDMVHPLAFSHDDKKHPKMVAIPTLYKKKDTKENFYKIYE